ncbi:Uncharacterised protein [Bordetella pertussis]|nr:Uncharacterised protein [Bordetella pertussis]CFT96448.1 Uncharacterised protein [Bordetella pertussis]CFW34163.1 Uncharacterised protein [Bordetella pertussis]
MRIGGSADGRSRVEVLILMMTSRRGCKKRDRALARPGSLQYRTGGKFPELVIVDFLISFGYLSERAQPRGWRPIHATSAVMVGTDSTVDSRMARDEGRASRP